MANIVEFIVKIRDMASGPMVSLARNGEGAFSRLSARVNSVGSSVNDLNSRIDALTRTRNISLDFRQINRVNSEIDALERRRDRLENAGRAGGNAFGTGFMLAGIGAIGAFGMQAIKGGMERQQDTTSFEVMAGKKDGSKLQSNLTAFATDTIYGNEVFGEAKQMLGFGIAAKNIMPALSMMGDIAGGVPEKMKSLALVFSQTASAGKLMGQDLLQYSGLGFNPLMELSKMTGKTYNALREDMGKGKILFSDVARAMEHATSKGGLYYKMMEKMSKSDSGKIMAFTGAISTMTASVGTKLLPILGTLSEIGSNLAGNVPLLYGIATAVGAGTVAWGAYTLYSKSAAIWGALAAAAPFAAIAATVGAITYMCIKYDSWGKSAKAVWEITQGLATGTALMFKDSAEAVGFFFEKIYYKIKGFFEHIGDLVSNTAKGMGLALKGDFGGAKSAFNAKINTEASGKLDKLQAAWGKNHAGNLAGIKSAFGGAQAQVGNIHFDMKNGKSVKQAASNYLNDKFDMSGMAGGKSVAPDSVTAIDKGITGGGVRNITINIAKQGVDQITIHAATVTESAAQIRQVFSEMFSQVINSGSAMVANN